jgi:hypothetical protein
MSNIIQTVDGDALSKIVDYLSIQEVLNLGHTSRMMHGHVCSLPWFCECCQDAMLVDGGIPHECACCSMRFCEDCTSMCENTAEVFCIICPDKCEECEKACLCCIRTCEECNDVKCLDCEFMPTCDTCSGTYCLECKPFHRCEDCEKWQCEDCTAGDVMFTCGTCNEAFFCTDCRDTNVCQGCDTVTCENCEPCCQQLDDERLDMVLGLLGLLVARMRGLNDANDDDNEEEIEAVVP